MTEFDAIKFNKVDANNVDRTSFEGVYGDFDIVLSRVCTISQRGSRTPPPPPPPPSSMPPRARCVPSSHGAYAHRMLMGACDPMLCPIHGGHPGTSLTL